MEEKKKKKKEETNQKFHDGFIRIIKRTLNEIIFREKSIKALKLPFDQFIKDAERSTSLLGLDKKTKRQT